MVSNIQRLVQPLNPMHPAIDTVSKVLDHVVKEILKIDGKDRDYWESHYMRETQKANADRPRLDFLKWFATFIADLIHMDSVVPGSSTGIFFRVPSWLTPLVKFILEHDTGVQDELLRVGYRSFDWLNLTAAGAAQGSRGGGSGAVSTLDGDTRAAGSFSVFCGYNIRECPECVGDGISFSGCGISEQQRHLTEQLSHQFHARAAGFHVVEEEEEEGEARDDLPLPSSILSPKANEKKTAEVISYYTRFCMPTPDSDI
jgi:hypothetical protein